MNGSTYHVHEEATTCEYSILSLQVYVQVQIDAKFVHGFWICQIEVVSIVWFNNLVFSELVEL